MFGLSWTQIWALVARADEMSALAKDIAQVLDKHKQTIDYVIETLADEKKDPATEKRAKKAFNVLIDRSSNVDNN